MSSTAAASSPLSGKSALVTGASRGIGMECVRALHSAGARVFMLARDTAAMDRLIAGLAHHEGAPIEAIGYDLEAQRSVDRAIERVRSRLGGAPDILVLNAGRFLLAPAEETRLDDFERVMRVNVTAHFAIARYFLPDLKARGAGHIITMGSTSDRTGLPGNAAYAASKFAIRGLHEVLREELRGTGVRVTLVSPAQVDTAIWDEVDAGAGAGLPQRHEMLAPASVADAVLFAVSRPADVNIDELRLSRS